MSPDILAVSRYGVGPARQTLDVLLGDPAALLDGELDELSAQRLDVQRERDVEPGILLLGLYDLVDKIGVGAIGALHRPDVAKLLGKSPDDGAHAVRGADLLGRLGSGGGPKARESLAVGELLRDLGERPGVDGQRQRPLRLDQDPLAQLPQILPRRQFGIEIVAGLSGRRGSQRREALPGGAAVKEGSADKAADAGRAWEIAAAGKAGIAGSATADGTPRRGARFSAPKAGEKTRIARARALITRTFYHYPARAGSDFGPTARPAVDPCPMCRTVPAKAS